MEREGRERGREGGREREGRESNSIAEPQKSLGIVLRDISV